MFTFKLTSEVIPVSVFSSLAGCCQQAAHVGGVNWCKIYEFPEVHVSYKL